MLREAMAVFKKNYDKEEVLIEGHEHICRPCKIPEVDGFCDECQHCKTRIEDRASAFGCLGCEYFLHRSCMYSDSVINYNRNEFEHLQFDKKVKEKISRRCKRCSRRCSLEERICKFCTNPDPNPNTIVESMLNTMMAADIHWRDGVDWNKFKYAPCGKESTVWSLCENNNTGEEDCIISNESVKSCCRLCNSFVDGSRDKSRGSDPIQHPLHPYHLIAAAREYSDMGSCVVCLEWISCVEGDVFLSCIENSCDFRMHYECTPPMPSLKFEYKQHHLFLVPNKLKLQNPHKVRIDEDPGCGKCGKTGGDWIFKCLIPKCNYYLHVYCVPFELPDSIKHENHYERLTFADADSFIDEGTDGCYYCDLCQYDRDPTASVYRCEECNFNAHSYCALSYNQVLPKLIAEWMSSAAKAESDVAAIKEKQQIALFQCQDVTQRSIKDLTKEMDAAVMELERMERRCSQYIITASSAVESIQIGCSLNDDDDEQSQRSSSIQHPLHPPHPLYLHPKFKSFSCSFCRRSRFGNVHIGSSYHEYRCDECNFILQVGCGCASLSPPPSYKIQLGEHLLFQVEKPSHILWRDKCQNCHRNLGDGHGNSPIFVCVVPGCQYALHLHCLPLSFPDKVKHKDNPYDDYLVYTKNPPDQVDYIDGEDFNIEPFVDEEDDYKEACYCDDQSCEQPRNPNFPFYYCEESSFSAHITCCISRELPSMFEEYEKKSLLASGGSAAPLAAKMFEQDVLLCRLGKEYREALLAAKQEELKVIVEKLQQMELASS